MNVHYSMIINADLKSVAYVSKDNNKSGWSEIDSTNFNTHDGLLHGNPYFCPQQIYNIHERQKMQSMFISLRHQIPNLMSIY